MVKVRDLAIRVYAWAYAHRRTLYRMAAVMVILAVVIIITTGHLYAQSNMDDMYNRATSLVSGPLGKTIAILAFIGGIIALFFGNIQLGILALLGAILIAFGPAIINAIFG